MQAYCVKCRAKREMKDPRAFCDCIIYKKLRYTFGKLIN